MAERKSNYRIGAELRIGWQFAWLILLVPWVLRIVAALAVAFGATLGALWLWLALPHWLVACLLWLAALATFALCRLSHRRRVTVQLALAGAMFFAAAVFAVIKG
jgi:hypothetical protein